MRDKICRKSTMLLLWLGGAVQGNLFATDHLDSPRAPLDPSADLTDLFAFMPDSDTFVVAVNSFTAAGYNNRFSDAVIYRFHLLGLGDGAAVLTGNRAPDAQRASISCEFAAPAGAARTQRGRCYSPELQLDREITVSNKLRKAKTGLSVGAGLVTDPFVVNGGCGFGFDPRCVRKYKTADNFEGKGVKNLLENLNVMTIVLELDAVTVQYALGWKPGHFVGVYAETLLRPVGSRPEVIIDRLGRPEITNFLIMDDYAKYPYNREDTATLSMRAPLFPLYAGRMKGGIGFLDSREKDYTDPEAPADPPADWQGTQLDQLTSILLADYLVIDPSKKSDFGLRPRSGYFGIELDLINGKAVTSSGGRTPKEDVIDQHLTFLINGPSRRLTRQDGVAKRTDVPERFPYFSSVNPTSYTGVK